MILTGLLERHAKRIERVCTSISKHLSSRLYEFAPGNPYMGRFYLVQRDKIPEVLQDYIPGVCLNYFFRGDADVELHSHPWRIALSVILTNGYTEERRTARGILRRVFRPGSINIIRSSDYHRVELINPSRGAWTLFFTWDRVQEDWDFWHPQTGNRTPWEQFVDERARSFVTH